MKLSFFAPLALLAAAVFAQPAMPRLNTVEPPSGKAGDVITVAGENLDKPTVVKLYLTDGKNAAKAGRFSLMVLTGGKDPKLIEQPVKVTIEE
jgi:hypothetical protein